MKAELQDTISIPFGGRQQRLLTESDTKEQLKNQDQPHKWSPVVNKSTRQQTSAAWSMTSAQRRSAFVDFLLLDTPDTRPELWESFPALQSYKGPFSKVNTSLALSNNFSSFLETKGYEHIEHIEVQAPSMATALFLGTGLAAVGAGAYFFTRPPSETATEAPQAPEGVTRSEMTDPPAPVSEETSQRLTQRGQLLSDLESLDSTDPRREEILQQIRQLDQEIEASNQEVLAGRTLRQLIATDSALRANTETASFLQMVYTRIAPAFTRMEQMKRLLEARVANVSTRVPQVISEEVDAATEETRNLLQIPLPDARFNISDHLPSLTMLLAGLMAPLQLKVMYADNILRLGISGAILSMDLLALVTAHGTRQELIFTVDFCKATQVIVTVMSFASN